MTMILRAMLPRVVSFWSTHNTSWDTAISGVFFASKVDKIDVTPENPECSGLEMFRLLWVLSNLADCSSFYTVFLRVRGQPFGESKAHRVTECDVNIVALGAQ